MSDVLIDRPELNSLGQYEFGWSDSDAAGASARRGINEEVVTDISNLKKEPAWMLKLRLKGLKLFGMKPMPTWGLSGCSMIAPLYLGAGKFFVAVVALVAGYHGAKAALGKWFK